MKKVLLSVLLIAIMVFASVGVFAQANVDGASDLTTQETLDLSDTGTSSTSGPGPWGGWDMD